MTTPRAETAVALVPPVVPDRMRAAVYTKVGDPFTVETIDTPRPRATEVLIKVRACGLVPNTINQLDPPPMVQAPPLPAVYGLDPAGVVVEVGESVHGIDIGDRVYVNPLRYCGNCRPCRKGQPLACDYAALNGYFGTGPKSAEMVADYPQGGYAEYMVAPHYSVVKLPDNVSFETGARWGYLGTAYSGLRRAAVGPNTTVLINGISGTLGLGATLFALALGCSTILGVGRDAERLSRVRALAPDRIHVHTPTDERSTEQWARGLTDGYGADVVVDALPERSPATAFTAAAAALARGGVHVNIGGILDDVSISPPRIMTSNQTYLGSFWFTSEEGQEMSELAAAGLVDFEVFQHRIHGLGDIDAAMASLAAGDRDGGFTNVVIAPFGAAAT
ncbi:alcohol dehydrogenase catalytic domain-containing protein [Rhodococcus sp. NPDC057297]|uniref:alcohol dehydrogenase catalytic domain-containing protein n=1 Tax=Rhodococcus sp. NPDC057297 TaxID=3346090 RepID=UPI00362D13CC